MTQAKTAPWRPSSSTHGLIDGETVQRIACDATVVVAVDDEVGHTMYEGRARRFPTGPSVERSSAGTGIADSRAVPT